MEGKLCFGTHTHEVVRGILWRQWECGWILQCTDGHFMFEWYFMAVALDINKRIYNYAPDLSIPRLATASVTDSLVDYNQQHPKTLFPVQPLNMCGNPYETWNETDGCGALYLHTSMIRSMIQIPEILMEGELCVIG